MVSRAGSRPRVVRSAHRCRAVRAEEGAQLLRVEFGFLERREVPAARGLRYPDWGHQIDSNQLWLKGITVSGFSSGAYLPAHPHAVRPALEAALNAVAAGLGQTEIDVLPFSEAVTAHERMESRNLNGRIVLTPDSRSVKSPGADK